MYAFDTRERLPSGAYSNAYSVPRAHVLVGLLADDGGRRSSPAASATSPRPPSDAAGIVSHWADRFRTATRDPAYINPGVHPWDAVSRSRTPSRRCRRPSRDRSVGQGRGARRCLRHTCRRTPHRARRRASSVRRKGRGSRGIAAAQASASRARRRVAAARHAAGSEGDPAQPKAVNGLPGAASLTGAIARAGRADRPRARQAQGQSGRRRGHSDGQASGWRS